MTKILKSISGGTDTPISADEAERLKHYVDSAMGNNSFSYEDAEDFYNLSSRLVYLRSTDKGAWAIYILAGFINAFYGRRYN